MHLLTVHHTWYAHHLTTWISKEDSSQVNQQSIEKQSWLHHVPTMQIRGKPVWSLC